MIINEPQDADLPRRSRQRRKGQTAAVLGLTPAILLGFGLAPQAATSVAVAPAASIDRQVKDARTALTDASKAVEEAHRALERATAKIPAAEAAVTAAQQAADRAAAAEAAAEQALAAAKAKVVAQRAEIALVQARIDELVRRISALAHQAYISGGEPRAIEVLLQTSDPNDFSLQLESARRAARKNDNLFDQTTAARAELAAQLVTLRELSAAAAENEAEASRQAAAMQTAKDQAVAAAAALKQAVAAREQAATEIEHKRDEAKALYRRLLAQQARLEGILHTTGTIRSGRAAIEWAMGYLGRGAYYDGLCLGFVDDSYAVTSGRVDTAIAQWYRAVDHGKAHPHDRHPPIGAQVFWWSGNPAKHIALYAGNGMVISTGVDGDRVGMRPMEYLDSYGPYLGWAEPYYG